MTTKLGPHGHGKLAVYLRARLAELAPVKSQVEVAREVGFVNPNNITMIKNGNAKLALDRVAALARALDVDPAHLFNLALEQTGLETTAAEVAEIFGVVPTRNESQWLEVLREASGHSDPPITKKARTAIMALFGK
jgi:plasmid maintenance system antidote protein VapI